MHFAAPLFAVFAAIAAAQSSSTLAQVTPSVTTSSGAASTATDLPGLVAQLPKCALGCLQSAAQAIHCDPSNFNCLCSNSTGLVANIGPCILLGSCSSSDISKATNLAQQICSDVGSASPSALASASNIVTSAIGTASATAASTAASSTTQGNYAPAMTDLAIGAMKMAGIAGAFAAFAL